MPDMRLYACMVQLPQGIDAVVVETSTMDADEVRDYIGQKYAAHNPSRILVRQTTAFVRVEDPMNQADFWEGP